MPRHSGANQYHKAHAIADHAITTMTAPQRLRGLEPVRLIHSSASARQAATTSAGSIRIASQPDQTAHARMSLRRGMRVSRWGGFSSVPVAMVSVRHVGVCVPGRCMAM